MRASLKWLREFVDVPSGMGAQELAHRLTMAGLEVEGIENFSERFADALVAKIIKIERVTDKLSKCEIDVGSKKTVICGASNIAEGNWVAYLPIGAKVFEGPVLEEKTIKGVPSYGMLCSEKDLGISVDNAGVLILDDEIKTLVAGQRLVDALELDAEILEIGITPNRPDALSHIGLARDIAAAVGARLKVPPSKCKENSGPVDQVLHININDKKACPRYAGRVIDDVNVGESPLWLKARLTALGMRPVNNIVDATNYVMLMRGHPLHAFDFAKLARLGGRVNIEVRRAKSGETITTLDGVERKLGSEDLVITDTKEAIALAGVMGGENSEVSENTSTIVLESAYFEPSVVRKMARAHGLSSEASYRFERGADPNGVLQALDEAAGMIAELGGGKVRRDAVDAYPEKIEPVVVPFRYQKFLDLSGFDAVSTSETNIQQLFLALGIETQGKRADAISFVIPTFRPDLEREVDLIEEAMRLIGYDRVPTSLGVAKGGGASLHDTRRAETLSKVRESLLASGFSEAINYSFGAPDKMARFASKPKASVTLSNPLGEELSVMRQSLLPGLLDNTVTNVRQGNHDIRLFETGAVFLGTNPKGKAPDSANLEGSKAHDSWAVEEGRVSGVMLGREAPVHFRKPRVNSDFFDAKGVVTQMLAALGVEVRLSEGSITFAADAKAPFLHPGKCARVLTKESDGKQIEIGALGELHPELVEVYDLNRAPTLFEMNLDLLTGLLNDRILLKPISRYPSVQRDLALLVDESTPAADLVDLIKDAVSSDVLSNMELFDVYTGKGVPEGKKSLAFSLTLNDFEKTLTDEEVNAHMDSILKVLQKKVGAEVR